VTTDAVTTDAVSTDTGTTDAEMTEAAARGTLPVEFLFTLTANIGEVDPAVLTGTPSGTRMVVTAMSGTFDGPRLRGRVEPVAGGDWVVVRSDGSMLLDVRLVLRTYDDALIYMTYSGIGVRTETGLKVRTAPQFETGDERYAWLNTIQAVAHGSRGDGTIVYDVYGLV
jgi:hypothetical protein